MRKDVPYLWLKIKTIQNKSQGEIKDNEHIKIL